MSRYLVIAICLFVEFFVGAAVGASLVKILQGHTFAEERQTYLEMIDIYLCRIDHLTERVETFEAKERALDMAAGERRMPDDSNR